MVKLELTRLLAVPVVATVIVSTAVQPVHTVFVLSSEIKILTSNVLEL